MTNRPLRPLLACLILPLILTLTASPAASDGPVFEPVDPAAETTTRAARPGTTLLLPWFEVDRTSASGTTTLLAVRNTRSSNTNEVEITFFSVAGDLLATRVVDLDPYETATFNLRNISGLTADADGVARGYALVDGFWSVTGDSFQVTPGENFATGQRLADAFCDEWDLRFLSGGGFDGSTGVRIVVSEPLGNNPATSTPTAVVTAVAEDGDVIGSRNLFLGNPATQLTADEILDAFGPGVPAFGSLLFDFASGADGGYVEGTYSAEGRYSIGLAGTCLELN